MSSRRRTQEAITRRAAVLLLCVRVRRRGGNENEHELVDEGIIKELSFLQRARALQLRACSFSSIPSSIEHHLPARVSPLPLLVCTPSQQRAVGPIAACAPREIQQQRTHAIACSYCGPGRGPRKQPQQCLARIAARPPLTFGGYVYWSFSTSSRANRPIFWQQSAPPTPTPSVYTRSSLRSKLHDDEGIHDVP